MAGPLRKELQTYRTSKNADLKLDGGFFYRRSVPSKSASYHGVYTDLYDNADDIHTIEGGMKPRYSQFDTTLPEKPTFGSGNLSGLYFSTKIQNNDYLNPANSTTSAGEGVGIKAFKIDSLIDTEGGNSDGSTMIDNEDILAFSTYFTESPPHEEYNDVFDGVGEESTTVVKQGQLVVQKEAYLSLDDAHAMGRYYGKKESRLLARPMAKSTYFKNFGETYNGQKIVKVFRKKTKGRYVLGGFTWVAYKRGSITYCTSETKTGLTGKKRHDTFRIRGDDTKKIKYIETNAIPTTSSPYTVSRTNVVTTTNSTLFSVKEAKTFNELSSTGGTKEIAWGKVGLSSENVHEGGQSIKMHTFWPALSNQDGWRKSSIYYPADSTSSHTHQRQECYITKKIPVPATYQDQKFGDGTSVKIPQVVSTKINIKKLANCESKHYKRANASALHTAGVVENANIPGQTTMSRIFTRGIAICFSEFAPGYSDATTKSQDDTFYTFMLRHHPGMENTNAIDRDNGALDFYGVFLANEKGVLTINALGSAAATNYLTFLTDSKTDKIGTNTTPTDTVSISDDDLGDRWLEFNFIIDPDSGGTTLMICDGDDGRAIAKLVIPNSASTVTTGAPQTNVLGSFPQYMSIWNVNTVNPNSGISAADGDHGPFANASSSVRDNFKGFSDTGLVFESGVGDHDDDAGTADTRASTFNPSVTNTLTNVSVSDYQTGDSSGTMEKYWALAAGSEFYLAYSTSATIYGFINNESQYVSESMYAGMTFEGTSVTVAAGTPILVQSAAPIDGGAEPGTDMENIIYVDSIKVHNAIPEIENATVHNENKSAGLIRIPATHKTYTTSYADIGSSGDWDGSNDEGPMRSDTWSYMSFGFATKAAFEGSAKNFLLSGFNSNNPRNTVVPLNSHDSQASHIRAGYTDDDRVLGGSTGIDTFDNSDGTPDPGNENGLVVFSPEDGSSFNHELVLQGTNYCENFTQKGFFTVEFNERTSEAATSRENPYCSSRIIDLIDIKNGIIEVDNDDIFRLDPDEEYIMYKNGASYSNANYLTGLKLIEKDGGVLTFNKSLLKADSGAVLFSEETKGNAFIGPKRFWLIIAVLNKSANDDNSYLPERSYESIVGTTGVHTIGATYNEYKFSDEKYYKFKRNMDPFTNLESNDIRLDVDFGFGAMSDEVPDEAGHTGLLHLPLSTSLDDAATDNVRIDISGMVNSLKPELGSTLPLLLTPLSSSNTATLKIFAEEASNEYDKPYLITEFEDKIPEISDFIVEPDMENPYYPRYRWSCGADDAWYGFLNIDSKSINNQYHNAVIHVPMNEEDRHAKHPATPSLEKIQGLTNADSGVLKNIKL